MARRLEGWKTGGLEGWKAGRLEGWRLEGWKAGRLEGWKAGRLEDWRAEGLEGWKAGRLGWKAGKLEGWKAGRLEGWKAGVQMDGYERARFADALVQGVEGRGYEGEAVHHSLVALCQEAAAGTPGYAPPSG